MKKLPDAELRLMQIIWDIGDTVTRAEIEQRMDNGQSAMPSTILTLLSRLHERGFLEVAKKGKINYYTPKISRRQYWSSAGKGIFQNIFGSSLADFTAAMYDGGEIGDEDLRELRAFIDEKLDK